VKQSRGSTNANAPRQQDRRRADAVTVKLSCGQLHVDDHQTRSSTCVSESLVDRGRCTLPACCATTRCKSDNITILLSTTLLSTIVDNTVIYNLHCYLHTLPKTEALTSKMLQLICVHFHAFQEHFVYELCKIKWRHTVNENHSNTSCIKYFRKLQQ